MWVLIGGRVITGIGAGGMVPISMAITADLISPRERGKWMGMSQVLFGGFTIVAPAFGGWITDSLGWRWIFYSVAILGGVSLTVAWFGIRVERPARRHQLDFVGASLIMGSAGALLIAVTLGGDQYAWESPVIVSLLASAAVLLVLLPFWERRVVEPIIPLTLFGNRTFVVAQIGIVGSHGTLLSTMTLAPLVVQGVLGLSAARAGSLMLGYSIALIVVGFLAGQFMTRTGHYRGLLLMSPLILAYGCYRLTQLGLHSTEREATLDLIILGAGIAPLAGTIIVVVQNAVGWELQGMASAATAFSRIMGGAIAVAVVGAILTARVGSELQKRMPDVHDPRGEFSALVAGRSDPRHSEVRAAFAASAPGAFAVLIPLLGLTFVAMLFVEPRDLRRTLREAAVEPLP
jgi:MFS family permease